MANDFNQVTFTGRLGKDPDSHTFNNGDTTVKFSLASSENWRDKNSGERKEKTEWVNVVIRNPGLCKIALDYLKKGSHVFVQGKQETRKWQDQSGNDKFMTECVLGMFGATLKLLDGRSDSDARGGRDDDRGGRDDDRVNREAFARRAPASTGSLIDEDIPFNCEWR
jgi:single-strand DNA-binding protein